LQIIINPSLLPFPLPACHAGSISLVRFYLQRKSLPDRQGERSFGKKNPCSDFLRMKRGACLSGLDSQQLGFGWNSCLLVPSSRKRPKQTEPVPRKEKKNKSGMLSLPACPGVL